MCGNRRVVKGVKAEDLFANDDVNNERTRDLASSKGREIDEIPLCVRCVEEIVSDEANGEHLIPLALERVEQFDGGLSRRRWEMRHAESKTPVPNHSRHQNREGNCRTPSPIYVSLRNPLDGPTFRRSPTKPIPKWMQYLPSRRPGRQDSPEPRPVSIVDDHFTSSGSSILGVDSKIDNPPPPVPPHTVPLRSTPQTYAPAQMSRPFTFITEEPVQRPSSKLGPGRFSRNKHVHFDTFQPRDSESTDKAKSPLESSEYMEKYHYTAARKHKDEIGYGLDALPLTVSSPRRRDIGSNPEFSAAEGSLLKVKDQYSSTECRSNAATGREYGKEGYALYDEHASSSNLHTGGDGVFDFPAGKRRPLGFQDQLKKMFGFT